MKNQHEADLAIAQMMEYERQIRLTEAGRKSERLRLKGHETKRSGNFEAAFALYQEAAALFEATDLGAAAAACWFDLAEALRQRQRGNHAENLRSAEVLFLRALASPVREKDPHRAAMTRTHLASCLRHLAQQPSEARREARLLDEAHRLLREAIQLRQNHGPAGWSDVAGAWNNLGALFQQRGMASETTRAYEEGLRVARKLHAYEQKHPDFKRDMITDGDGLVGQLLFNLASHLHLNVCGAEPRQIVRLFNEAIDLESEEWRQMAQLGLAQYFLAQPTPDARARAAKTLEGLKWEHLPYLQIVAAARLYMKAGLSETAAQILTNAIATCLENRIHARADHVADMESSRAQQLSSLLARVYASAPIHAVHSFLALEHTSGLRFMDTWRQHAWQPAEPVDRELLQQRQLHSQCSAHLGELLGILKTLPPPVVREAVTGMAFEKAPSNNLILPLDLERWPEGFCRPAVQHQYLDFMHSELEQATREPDPLAFLEQCSEAHAAQVIRIMQVLNHRNPQWSATLEERTAPLNRHSLEALLHEHPDSVFLRISLQDDLLLAAVWLEEGALVARASVQSVPNGWTERLLKMAGQQQGDRIEPLPCTLTADLQAIDFSTVLPVERRSKVVILPSLIASLLPLSALGPQGSTLLDRFDEVTWLPSLGPLRVPAPAGPARHGTLTVAPETTHFHSLALHEPLEDETPMRGTSATVDAVVKAVFSPDVVCFYSHGAPNSNGEIEVQLSDNPLPHFWLDPRWHGLERIELWACQTGVNVPSHPLTPLHDEAFGLDVEFLRRGVRSAIGSLWKIPDFVTASLVNRYRKGLRAGISAPRALADAQRWWRDEGCRRLTDQLELLPEDQALRAFAAKLGMTDAAFGGDELSELLGPVPPSGCIRPATERQALLARLASPLSWAGIRFIGLCNHRPQEAWTRDHFRPLTPAEQEEVAAILHGTTALESAARLHLDTAQERELAELISRRETDPLTPELALQVARCYQARSHSAHAHNLLAALAWLHDAMALHKLHAVQLNELRRAAAWLWMELATPELFLLLMHNAGRPDVILLQRAAHLLASMPSSTESRPLKLWLKVLSGEAEPNETDAAWLARMTQEAVDAALALTDRTDDCFRASIVACELLRVTGRHLKADTARLLEHTEKLMLRRDSIDLQTGQWFLEHRLGSLVDVIRLAQTKVLPDRLLSVQNLTPRDMARAWYFFDLQKSLPSGEASRLVTELYNQSMSAIECSIFGDIDDPETSVLRFTGTVGTAYRFMLGHYIQTQLHQEQRTHQIEHYIAVLQSTADLHLNVIRRVSRLAGRLISAGKRLETLPESEVSLAQRQTVNACLQSLVKQLRLRDHFLLLLEEAAAHSEPGDLTTMQDLEQLLNRPLVPAELDPFRLDAAQLESNCRHEGDLLSWSIGADAHDFLERKSGQARTAAFQVVRGIETMTKEINQLAQQLREIAESLNEKSSQTAASLLNGILDPGRGSDENERTLRSLGPDTILLSVSICRGGAYQFLALWNHNGKVQGHHALMTELDSDALREQLMRLFSPATTHESAYLSLAGARANAWHDVGQLLSPVLEELLAPLRSSTFSASKRWHFRVFMPGSLRVVPWCGVPLWGKPLFHFAESFQHTLTIDANPMDRAFAPRPVSHTACLVARMPAHEAETGFGVASITSLRHWFPVALKLEQAPPSGEQIVEATVLEKVASEPDHIRLYSASKVGIAYHSTHSFLLERSRTMRSMCMPDLILPRCQLVEIWADTAGMAQVRHLSHETTDRIPGIAHAFLAAGAAQVLDTAWPIPDLLKALLCERFGILLRTSHPHPTEALPEALRGVAQLLKELQSNRTHWASISDVLTYLDNRRQAFALNHGLSGAGLEPLASLSGRPSLKAFSMNTLLDELCQPVHLAALRIWG